MFSDLYMESDRLAFTPNLGPPEAGAPLPMDFFKNNPRQEIKSFCPWLSPVQQASNLSGLLQSAHVDL